MKIKTGVLLVNLGTPDSPSVGDVRKYLRQFLLDPRVIDIHTIGRHLLVHGIIAPFRAPKSAKTYKAIWTDTGSPLLVFGKQLTEKIQSALPDFIIELAMRYQNPSVVSGLDKLRSAGCTRIIVIPLFPQYASATSGSVVEEVMRITKKWMAVPEIIFAGSFHNHPAYINAIAELGKKYNHAEYDHVLFSFHGVPERQIKKTTPQNNCLQTGCCNTLQTNNFFCYRAQCFNTATLIAQQLKITPDRFTVCFQSRLGKTPWIQPYANETISQLAKAGAKKLLVFSPAFVADCLETIFEIGVEYNQEFQKEGGEKIQLVESLNANAVWIDALVQIISDYTGSLVS